MSETPKLTPEGPRARTCTPLPESFFNDGPYYVLTSASLGARGETPESVAAALGDGDPERVRELLTDGVCVPLFFPGDCAFDGAIVVAGDLSDREAEEWIGRIAWKLDIPCGKFLIVGGGGDEDDLAVAVSGEEPDPHYHYYQAFDVEPGRYLVEVYAFVSSMTVDFSFGQGEPLEEWFRATRPGAPTPAWLEMFTSQGSAGEMSDELVSYIVRLAPLAGEPAAMPELVDDVGWCGEFELRRPGRCPLGIPRSELLG
jgi:hypothetical protein